MKKIALMLTAAATLTACVESGSNVSVMQNDTLALSCPSIHMKTTNGLPMRCGPQSVSPYTFQ